MTYLLDVNALLAFGVNEHEFHNRVAKWAASVVKAEHAVLATCAITELGFLRVLTQVPSYAFAIAQGKALLSELKAAKGLRFTFLSDDRGLDRLPAWVTGPKQITDGHLAGLAEASGAILATLDEHIPDTLLIPGK
jgi:predicted nucleic acid-binding protein